MHLFYSCYNTVWIANTEIVLDPNNSVIKEVVVYQSTVRRRTRGGQGGWQAKLLEKQYVATQVSKKNEGVRVAGRVSC